MQQAVDRHAAFETNPHAAKRPSGHSADRAAKLIVTRGKNGGSDGGARVYRYSFVVDG